MSDVATLWTLPELTERVVAALASGDGGIPSGRVRELPDARTIRWYQTTGLVDRPELRGRTAYYGRRHLLQLLAIKRLQAQGRPLSEIQATLAGLSDHALAQVAEAPEQPAEPGESGARAVDRFWTRPPAAATSSPTPGPPSRRITIDAIQLRQDVTLLLHSASWHLDPADEATVLEAAAPLLDTLQRLGVITPGPTGHEPEADRRPKEQG